MKIPAQQLGCAIVDYIPDVETIVFSKHFHDLNMVCEFKGKIVYDICDHHFDGKLGDYYRDMSKLADVIICPTQELQKVILRETGKLAYIIPDPYEYPLRPPAVSDSLLWFGHPSNLPSLTTVRDEITLPLTVISQKVDYWHPITPWSPRAMTEAFAASPIVIIPTVDSEKARCKSANRMIEAIRSGLFVIAGESPAHEEFRDYTWIGSITEGLKLPREQMLDRIVKGQAYIEKYSPESIGALWKQAV